MKLLLFMILVINVLYGNVITCGDAMKENDFNKLYLHNIAQKRAQSEIESFMEKKVLIPYMTLGARGTPRTMSALIETFWCETNNTPLHSAYYNFYSRNKTVFKDEQANKNLKIKKEFYNNGQLKTETSYLDNIEEGKKRGYYKNGALEYETFYKNGKQNSYEIVFYQDGNIKYYTDLLNGKKNGIDVFYKTDGTISIQRLFKNNKVVNNSTTTKVKKETIPNQQDLIAYNKDKSVYFKRNQKYVCMNTGSFIGDDFLPNNDINQIKKYPTRFYVDDKNILHTDKGLRLNFQSIDKGVSIYADKETYYLLAVDDKKNKILLLGGSNQKYKGKGIQMMYGCTWTDNWTIGR